MRNQERAAHGQPKSLAMIDPWGLIRAAGYTDIGLTRDESGELTESTVRPPIGKILLEAKVLTPAQLMRVLAKQGEEPKKRFGEIALELGFCEASDVEWALLEQLRNAHPFNEIALRSDTDPEDLVDLLLAYVHQLELRLSERDRPTPRSAQSA